LHGRHGNHRKLVTPLLFEAASEALSKKRPGIDYDERSKLCSLIPPWLILIGLLGLPALRNNVNVNVIIASLIG
jgi:hypothetical protein